MLLYLSEQVWYLLPSPIASSGIEKLEVVTSFFGVFVVLGFILADVPFALGLITYAQHLAMKRFQLLLQAQCLSQPSQQYSGKLVLAGPGRRV